MMKRWSYSLLALLMAFSCAKTSQEDWDGPVIEINLETGEATKAGADGTQDGLDAYNENLISYVDFFFYPGGNTDTSATYHIRHTSGKRGSDVIRLKFDSDEINTLIFPVRENIRTATVFAIANYPETETDKLVPNEKNLPSLPDLLARTKTTDFVSPSSHKQPNFLMSGNVELTLRGRSQVVAAAGSVRLARYAAKLTIGINVAPEVTVGSEVWTPMLTGMQVYLVNGVKKVSLGGEVTPKTEDYFSYQNNVLRFAYSDASGTHFYFDKDGDYYNTYPTYMYPQHWKYGATEAPDAEPYLKLVVPWLRKGTTNQQQFYYKVLIPEDSREEFRKSFQRNNWYHINLDVSILGAETNEASLPIPGTCYVVDWQNKDFIIKTAEIGKARYLSVVDSTYNLYNISDPTPLAYVSSHPISIKNVTAIRPYYGTEKKGTQLFTDTENPAYVRERADGSKYLEYSGAGWLKDRGDAVVFTHPLNNDYTSESFDSSPYTIEYDLVHADDQSHTYICHQKIVQYPGIYIETTPNLDPATLLVNDPKNNNKPAYKPAHWGYTWVNGVQLTLIESNDILAGLSSDAERNAWKDNNTWRVIYYSSGGRDMVKITATVLPQSQNQVDEFIIGDPRISGDPDNLSYISNYGHSFATVVPIEGGNPRSLKYYYPTDETNRTVNMIAPSFRISSKHSGTEYDGTGLEQARLRCASYQENGFPAGRWRLPTKAEIRFASQLSANNIFEWQFSGNYWSAHGGVHVDTKNKSVTDKTLNVALIRCVYDSWYWGDERIGNDDTEEGQAKLNTFTWADQPR